MQLAGAMAVGLVALGAMPGFAFEMPANADPVYAELVDACLGALGLEANYDPESWIGHDTGDVEAVAWSNSERYFSTKDIPGVGGANLSTTFERYPGASLGKCVLSVEAPARPIAVADLSQAHLVGSIEGEGTNLSGTWRDDALMLFIRATMSGATGNFTLSVTRITKED
jgi:hypothetical protein